MSGPPIPLQEQIVAVRREIALRRRVYPTRVATGRMSSRKAAFEIACMEAVLGELEAAERRERLL